MMLLACLALLRLRMRCRRWWYLQRIPFICQWICQTWTLLYFCPCLYCFWGCLPLFLRQLNYTIVQFCPPKVCIYLFHNGNCWMAAFICDVGWVGFWAHSFDITPKYRFVTLERTFSSFRFVFVCSFAFACFLLLLLHMFLSFFFRFSPPHPHPPLPFSLAPSLLFVVVLQTGNLEEVVTFVLCERFSTYPWCLFVCLLCCLTSPFTR